MQAFEVDASQELRKRERGPIPDPFFPSALKAARNCEPSGEAETTHPLLSALTKEPAASAFLMTKAAVAFQVDATACFDSSEQVPCRTTSNLPSKFGHGSIHESCNRVGSRISQSTRHSRRSYQMYPTLVAATQMAISTIEENECEMELNHQLQQSTELQYGYCPHWDKTLTASFSRRYQRRNSCLGAMTVPAMHKVIATTATANTSDASIFQYETEILSLNHAKSPLLGMHRKVERRNSQTASMLYVATQMATIDENWGQLTLEDHDQRSTSPTEDGRANHLTSSFADRQEPVYKRRRISSVNEY